MTFSPFPWFPFLPRRGADMLKLRPAWLLPFLALAAVRAILMLLSERQTAEVVLSHLPVAGRAEAAEMLARGALVRALVEPARLLAGWSAFAGVLWVAVRALTPPEPVGYLTLLALETHAESVTVIAAGVSLIVSLATGDGALAATPGACFGPALLASGSVSFPLLSLLRSVNIFTLWYVALLATGIRILSGFTMRLSVIIAASAWVLSVLSDLGILTLLVTALHLRV